MGVGRQVTEVVPGGEEGIPSSKHYYCEPWESGQLSSNLRSLDKSPHYQISVSIYFIELSAQFNKCLMNTYYVTGTIQGDMFSLLSLTHPVMCVFVHACTRVCLLCGRHCCVLGMPIKKADTLPVS